MEIDFRAPSDPIPRSRCGTQYRSVAVEKAGHASFEHFEKKLPRPTAAIGLKMAIQRNLDCAVGETLLRHNAAMGA